MGSIGKIWEMLIPAQTKKKHFKAFKKMDPAQKPLHIGFEIMDWDDGLGWQDQHWPFQATSALISVQCQRYGRLPGRLREIPEEGKVGIGVLESAPE